jgi:predicted TIM-barrel fold metal-dependent hydrolase
MNRRGFLASASGLAAVAAEEPKPSRIIDVHTHFYDPHRPQGVPWPGKKEPVLYQTTLPDRYRKIVEPLGVTGTIVVEASPWLEDNQWVLDIARDNPIIVGLVGHVEAGKPDFKGNIDRFRKNRLFLGIRLGGGPVSAGVSNPAFVDDIKHLAKANLELDALGDPTMFASLVRLSDQVPKLRIVINHLPWDMPKEEAKRAEAQQALRELGKRPQVYAKVSGVLRRIYGRVPDDADFYRASLDEICEIFGIDRVIYASNWPVSDLMAPYATVLKVVREYFAAKGKEAVEKYFWKNSVAAYRWTERKG